MLISHLSFPHQTFEGHDASVLKVIFVSEGGQVLSRCGHHTKRLFAEANGKIAPWQNLQHLQGELVKLAWRAGAGQSA